jgi:hypothetical protein
MGMTILGAIKVSRSAPKISVKIVNNRFSTVGAFLRITRMGEPVAFAEYPPTRVTGSYMEFMFDDLLFDQSFGRYYAELVMEGLPRQNLYLQYIDDVSIEISSDA